MADGGGVAKEKAVGVLFVLALVGLPAVVDDLKEEAHAKGPANQKPSGEHKLARLPRVEHGQEAACDVEQRKHEADPACIFNLPHAVKLRDIRKLHQPHAEAGDPCPHHRLILPRSRVRIEQEGVGEEVKFMALIGVRGCGQRAVLISDPTGGVLSAV